jgi:H+-transporting ATPase
VAKSAAGVVLTEAGLAGIVSAVKEGRTTFQRILTYTLNSVMKKILQVLLPAVGLVMTGHAVPTPMLMVIVMITGDFLAMSLTTDRVRPSKTPNSWQIGRITGAGVILGICFLAFSTTLLAVGKFHLHLDTEALQALSVVGIVFGSQATTYVIRGRQHLWGLRPSI